MNLEEFEREGRALYSDFAEAVAAIIGAAIANSREYKLQQVQSRAKKVASLRQKLARRKLPLDSDVADLKDLAGCRAIFYTNTDVDRFLNSGIIESNFEVVERKLHYPLRQAEDAADLYMANHYALRLTETRSALPEYSRFAGLKCEFQVQTILNHSWAATAHDTIYKTPELESFGTEALKGIELRLARIAKKYLVPAGYEFDRVFHDFDRILGGKALLDDNALAAILEAPDNNERLAALDTFAESVLPFYDDVPGVFPEIARNLVEVAKVAKKTEPASRETPFGSLPPTTLADILSKIQDVLRPYRYLDIDLSLATLGQLWRLAETEDERKPLLSFAEALAKHDLHLWKRYGPVAQDLLLATIHPLSSDQRAAISPLLAKLLAGVLGTEVEGTTSSSTTLTIHRGAARASSKLESIRSKSIDILEDLASKELSRAVRGDVFGAMLAATEYPIQSSYSSALALNIMKDTVRVLEILTRHAAAVSFDERQSLEASIHRIFHRNSELPPAFREEGALAEEQVQVRQGALAFRDAANADPEFELYKVLVGFNSVYPAAWERTTFDWRADSAYREERAQALLDSVCAGDGGAWFERLTRFATTESRDLATFPVLGKFVDQLAERQPAMVLDWANREGPLVDKFLPGMLSGLMRSEHRDKVCELINCWIERGERLGDISWYLRFADPHDEPLVRRTVERAIEQNEIAAICNCIDAAVRQYEQNAGNLIEAVFLPGIRALAASNDATWVRRWTPWMDAHLLKALDEQQAGTVLDALIPHEKLEYDPEYIVAAIAEGWPDRVLTFLTDRQSFKRTPEAPRYYDAIPFEAHQLRDPLAKVPALVVAAARVWHQNWPSYFQYDGGKLIASAFPKLSNGFDAELDALIPQSPAFVVAILASYEGIPEIYPLIQKVVSQAEPGSELIEQARDALDESGVVSGEFGFADLNTERRERLKLWLESECEVVRDFAKDHIAYLDRRIAAETKRAEASIATRRLAFDEDLSDGPDSIPEGAPASDEPSPEPTPVEE